MGHYGEWWRPRICCMPGSFRRRISGQVTRNLTGLRAVVRDVAYTQCGVWKAHRCYIFLSNPSGWEDPNRSCPNAKLKALLKANSAKLKASCQGAKLCLNSKQTRIDDLGNPET